MNRFAALLAGWLQARLPGDTLDWLASAVDEIAGGASTDRFCTLISVASRHTRPRPLAPSTAERSAAGESLPGWEPERWNLLETVRVRLVLARPDLDQAAGAEALEEAFRYADEGEACALYRSLAFLPEPQRFAWRAGEGCRSNMLSVFEATALDTPYPLRCFDARTFDQAVVKSLFVEAPLWRLYGLDERLSPDLARMALDLAEERRSAGRNVQHELWLCLGTHGGPRGVESLESELDGDHTLGRRAAAYGLVRAGESARLEARLAGLSGDVLAAARDALAGNASQQAFRSLDPTADHDTHSSTDSDAS